MGGPEHNYCFTPCRFFYHFKVWHCACWSVSIILFAIGFPAITYFSLFKLSYINQPGYRIDMDKSSPCAMSQKVKMSRVISDRNFCKTPDNLQLIRIRFSSRLVTGVAPASLPPHAGNRHLIRGQDDFCETTDIKSIPHIKFFLTPTRPKAAEIRMPMQVSFNTDMRKIIRQVE